MLASELVEQLQAQIEQHGDHEVVSGLERTGYGEEVQDVRFADDPQDLEGNKVSVFDLVLADESLCAVGGF